MEFLEAVLVRRSLRKPVDGEDLPGKWYTPTARSSTQAKIVGAEPPKRLMIRWRHQDKPELKAEGESICTMELERSGPAVKLSITHTIEERAPSKCRS